MHTAPRSDLWRRACLQVLCLVSLTLLLTPRALAEADLTGQININEAPAKQLALLPGIGATKAKRIVTYRSKRRFKKTVELARVRGIGLKTVRKLKPFLRIQGPSTLEPVPRGHQKSP